MISLSKNKVCLKGTKILDIVDVKKTYGNNSGSYSTTGVPEMFPTVVASLG
jgi:hypothetical protein